LLPGTDAPDTLDGSHTLGCDVGGEIVLVEAGADPFRVPGLVVDNQMRIEVGCRALTHFNPAERLCRYS
jgi:hypothetical protein